MSRPSGASSASWRKSWNATRTSSRDAASSRSSARAGSRTTTVASFAPSSRAAARAEQAVAPAPRIVMLPGTGAPASASASTMPRTSVLYPCRPSSRNTTVFADPHPAATGSTWSSSGSTVRLSGIVSDSPAQSGSRPAMKSASSSAEHSASEYDQSRRPSASYAARCRHGDSEWAIGDPRTAAFIVW